MATPLKIKDVNGNIQQLTTAEENYIAYQIGLHLGSGDSAEVGSLNKLTGGTTVGTFSNTFFNQPVGTHPSTSITTGTTNTTIYQTNGTAAETDSDVLSPLMWVDSASQTGFKLMPDVDLNEAIDRYLSTIFTNEYPGSYRLAPSSPGGDWTVQQSAFTDTRTDGTSTTYNIYKKTSGSAPSTVRPLYVEDSAGGSGIKLREMLDRQIKYSFGQRAKTRIMGSGIGKVQLRSSTAGAPTDPGTWVAKGSATDTKQTTSQQLFTRDSTVNFQANYTKLYTSNYATNYTKLSQVAYQRLYTTNYTKAYTTSYQNEFSLTNYTATYQTGYTNAYQNEFTAGYTGGSYLLTFAGTYTPNYITRYTGNFNLGYVGTSFNTGFVGPSYLQTYTGNYIPNYLRDFTGTFTTGFATPYLQTYTGTYDPNYLRTFTGTFASGYATAYIQTYTGTYDPNYVTAYTGNFANTFAAAYVQTYTGNYIPNYLRNFTGTFATGFAAAYVQTYTGNYDPNYLRNFTGTFATGFAAAYQGTYTGNYDPNYLRNFTGFFANTFAAAYLQTYTGSYTPNYIRAYTSNFATNFAAAYLQTYTGNYVPNYIKTYTGNFANTFAAAYQGTYTGNYVPNYLRDFANSFVGGFVGSSFTTGFAINYLRNYSGNYLRNFVASFYIRGFENTYTGNFARGFIDYYTANYSRIYTGDYVSDQLVLRQFTHKTLLTQYFMSWSDGGSAAAAFVGQTGVYAGYVVGPVSTGYYTRSVSYSGVLYYGGYPRAAYFNQLSFYQNNYTGTILAAPAQTDWVYSGSAGSIYPDLQRYTSQMVGYVRGLVDYENYPNGIVLYISRYTGIEIYRRGLLQYFNGQLKGIDVGIQRAYTARLRLSTGYASLKQGPNPLFDGSEAYTGQARIGYNIDYGSGNIDLRVDPSLVFDVGYQGGTLGAYAPAYSGNPFSQLYVRSYMGGSGGHQVGLIPEAFLPPWGPGLIGTDNIKGIPGGGPSIIIMSSEYSQQSMWLGSSPQGTGTFGNSTQGGGRLWQLGIGYKNLLQMWGTSSMSPSSGFLGNTYFNQYMNNNARYTDQRSMEAGWFPYTGDGLLIKTPSYTGAAAFYIPLTGMQVYVGAHQSVAGIAMDYLAGNTTLWYPMAIDPYSLDLSQPRAYGGNMYIGPGYFGGAYTGDADYISAQIGKVYTSFAGVGYQQGHTAIGDYAATAISYLRLSPHGTNRYYQSGDADWTQYGLTIRYTGTPYLGVPIFPEGIPGYFVSSYTGVYRGLISDFGGGGMIQVGTYTSQAWYTGAVYTRIAPEPVNYLGNYVRERQPSYATAFYTRLFTGFYIGNPNASFARYTLDYTRDFIGFRAINYLTNYIRNYTPNYLRNYTRNFVGGFTGTAISEVYQQANYTQNYLRNYTRNRNVGYTGAAISEVYDQANYTQNYLRNYTRNRNVGYIGAIISEVYDQANYTQNYLRNYTRTFVSGFLGTAISEVYEQANYTQNYVRNYTRTFVGGFLGTPITEVYDQSAYTQNYVRNYTRLFTGGFTGTAIPEVYDQSAYTQNYLRNYTRNRNVGYTGAAISEVYDQAAYTLNYIRNYTRLFTGGFAGTAISEVYDQANYTQNYVRNYTRIFVGGFTGAAIPEVYDQANYTPNYTRAYTPNYTATYTSINDVGYTGTGIVEYYDQVNYTANYINQYTSNYTKLYTGDYNTQYLATYTSNYDTQYINDYTNEFSANYTAEYVGDYESLYTKEFQSQYLTDYLGNFIGNFEGETIDATSETNETYTLYVRIA